MTGSNGNAVDYFVDRHVREGRGERLAFADPWRSLSYGELAAGSARFAAGLRAAGIERELAGPANGHASCD
jgi:4-hydroxybenzoate-CoA ligase